MILLCPKVEESAPKIVADRLPALRESVSITHHESRQNIRVGASLRSWQAYAGLCAMATSQSRCRGAPGPGWGSRHYQRKFFGKGDSDEITVGR